jgi:transcription antitermination factor NusG
MNKEKKWYVVSTRPGWEKKVAKVLSQKNVENYCPLNQITRWANERKIIFEPLFASCVFVRLHDEEHLAVKRIKGIVNFLYWLSEPALIPDEEIQTIRFFVAGHRCIHLEKAAGAGIDPLPPGHTVKIYLPSMHYAMIGEERINSIAIIQSPDMALPNRLIEPVYSL